MVSCRDLILRKRPLLEQPRHVAAADVYLAQPVELDDRQSSHERLISSGARDAKLGDEGLRVEARWRSLSSAASSMGRMR
jgi:hypothetical protein